MPSGDTHFARRRRAPCPKAWHRWLHRFAQEPSEKGLWENYPDGNRYAPHAKNQPWFIYRNPRGPVQGVIPVPQRQPQVYNRWIADPFSKAFYRWCNRWLFCNKKTRTFLCVLTAVLTEKFWNYTLYSIVQYNNQECTMEYAYRKEREWKEFQEAEKERRRALGLPDEDEDDWDEDEEEEDDD